MVKKSPLDDPENAAHAWARYRQIMKLLMAVTVGTVLLAVGILFAFNGMISVHFYIAVAIGISFTMLLGGGLMGWCSSPTERSRRIGRQSHAGPG